MRGKRGLILGVANNRSIAWGIAKACHGQGAELAFTYQGDALKKRVEPLAQDVGGLVVGHCDVTEPSTIDAAFASIEAKSPGSLDFLVHAIAFSDKDQLSGRYVDTTSDNFSKTLLVSCYSFTALAQRVEKLMPRGGSSLLTLTYYGAEKWMPHYNVMGVAKAALEASVPAAPPPLISARRTSASTPSRRGRSRRWRHQASNTSATSSSGTSTMLRSGRSVTIEEVGDTAVYFLSDPRRVASPARFTTSMPVITSWG